MTAFRTIGLLTIWILWLINDRVPWTSVPINGYSTVEQCREDMTVWQAKLEQDRRETGITERVACFPSEFDPRPSTWR